MAISNTDSLLLLQYISDFNLKHARDLEPKYFGPSRDRTNKIWRGPHFSWEWKGTTYFVLDEMDGFMSWHDAEGLCVQHGGHLISIHGWEELEQLQNHLEKSPLHELIYYIGLFTQVSHGTTMF